MFALIKQQFIGLWASIINVSNHMKYMSIKNQQCMTHSTLINLHATEYGQEICYYLFLVNFERCVRSFNTLNDISNQFFVPDKIKDLNLDVKNWSAIASIVFAGKTVLFAPECLVVLIAKMNWRSI